jgi:hypothetical protein
MADADQVRIRIDHHGHSAKIEVNGVEIKYVTSLHLSLDGGDRMSRVTIELAPDVIEVDGEVAALELLKPSRVYIPRVPEVATSAG